MKGIVILHFIDFFKWKSRTHRDKVWLREKIIHCSSPIGPTLSSQTSHGWWPI